MPFGDPFGNVALFNNQMLSIHSLQLGSVVKQASLASAFTGTDMRILQAALFSSHMKQNTSWQNLVFSVREG